MRKKIANNQKITLVILIAIAFAVLLIVPMNNEAGFIIWGTKGYAPGGGIMCYCEYVPINCTCIIVK